MANEDNTRQLNHGNSEVLSAIRDLNGRLATVEEIILARLNDTRPFEHQMMARINELAASQTTILEIIAGIREEQAAMREEQAAMRADFNDFRQETNQNFKISNKKMALLSEEFLSFRAEQALLEKRVEVLEERAA